MEPSHVISALGVEQKLANSLVRFSLGRDSTRRDTTSSKELIKWNEPDSVMKALMDEVGLVGCKVRPPLVDVRPEECEMLKKTVPKWKEWM